MHCDFNKLGTAVDIDQKTINSPLEGLAVAPIFRLANVGSDKKGGGNYEQQNVVSFKIRAPELVQARRATS
ncbi:hypothetical protein ABMA57_00625 [Saccharospirillum sp. HFRX-1]|uniref:hypothetical protein n=1 Tax=unclassified Saccharospirillum TaxID=2633430 RepID=UPI003719D73E